MKNVEKEVEKNTQTERERERVIEKGRKKWIGGKKNRSVFYLTFE